MRFPREILSEHKFIVLLAFVVIFVGIFAGANRSAYEYYRKNAPNIPWENIPASALTYFAYNMRNARAIDRSIYQHHVITWKNQRKRQIEAAKRAWNAIGFYGLPL